MRPTVLILSLFGLLTGGPANGHLVAQGAPRADTTATAVVRTLYAEFRWEGNGEADRPGRETLAARDSAFLARFLTPRLAGLLLADQRCASAAEAVCALDFAPLWDSQDPMVTGIEMLRQDRPDEVTVLVKERGAANATWLRFSMKRLPAGWRVDDIRYGDGRRLSQVLGLRAEARQATPAPGEPWTGIHQVNQAPRTPACQGPGSATCLADTTRDVFNECCMSGSSSNWLLLPGAGDSLAIFVTGPGGQTEGHYVSAGLPGTGESWQEHYVNSAWFLRKRFRRAGAYTLEAFVETTGGGEAVPYLLRLWMAPTRGMGGRSWRSRLVRLGEDSTAQFIVSLPEDHARAVAQPAAFLSGAGAYRLLTARGDRVVICALPCTEPVTVELAGEPLAIPGRGRTVTRGEP